VAKIYTYKLLPDIDMSEVWFVFRLSDVIQILTDSGTLSFLYSKEERLIHTHFIPDSYVGDWCLESLSLEDFLNKFPLTKYTLHVISKRKTDLKGLIEVSIKEYCDYPRMIDELEIQGKIKTKPSKNWLANDTRKFWFLGDAQEYEVDCLGSGTCRYISEKVTDEWLELQHLH
jgi:hypothetical protein